MECYIWSIYNDKTFTNVQIIRFIKLYIVKMFCGLHFAHFRDKSWKCCYKTETNHWGINKMYNLFPLGLNFVSRIILTIVILRPTQKPSEDLRKTPINLQNPEVTLLSQNQFSNEVTYTFFAIQSIQRIINWSAINKCKDQAINNF